LKFTPPGTGLGFVLAPAVLVMVGLSAHAESNDSLQILKAAETTVQARLADFARTGRYELLVEARKLAASMNPRGDNRTRLSDLDESCLRLQLRVMLAIEKARDTRYDPDARENRFYLNVQPPDLAYPAGIDPKAIQNPAARKAYEDAIAENNRRNEKLTREIKLSDALDYAAIDVWTFVRNLGANSAARRTAMEIVEKTVEQQTLRARLQGATMPGLTR
jgi:hypothetical protein